MRACAHVSHRQAAPPQAARPSKRPVSARFAQQHCAGMAALFNTICMRCAGPVDTVCCNASTNSICPCQVDSCSALVEDMDGRLSILHWMDHYVEPADSSSAKSGNATLETSDTESAVSQQAALLFDILQLGNVPPKLKSPPKGAHVQK